MVKKRARKGKPSVQVTKPTAAVESPAEVSPEALYGIPADCRIWLATDQYGADAGVLVTAPGDLNAPIAFIKYNQDQKIDKHVQLANMIINLPTTIDGVSDHFAGFTCVDLRDRGRVGSTRKMPGWAYGIHLMPHDGDLAEHYIEWSPYCPVRFAEMGKLSGGARTAGASEATNHPTREWEHIAGVTETGDTLGKRVPVKRIEAPCTVGMVVMCCNGSDMGVVAQVTPSHCLVEFENGEVDAVPWNSISIECVVPAGMQIARPNCTEHAEKEGDKLYPPKV